MMAGSPFENATTSIARHGKLISALRGGSGWGGPGELVVRECGIVWFASIRSEYARRGERHRGDTPAQHPGVAKIERVLYPCGY